MANDQHEQNIRQVTDELIAHLRGDEDALRHSEADRLSKTLVAKAVEQGTNAQARRRADEAFAAEAQKDAERRAATANGRNRAVTREEAQRLMEATDLPAEPAVEEVPAEEAPQEPLGDTREFPIVAPPAEPTVEETPVQEEPPAGQAPAEEPVIDAAALLPPAPKATKRGFGLFRRRRPHVLPEELPTEEALPEETPLETVPEEVPAEEEPAEVVAETAPAEEVPAETPAEEIPAEETPAGAPAEEAPAEEAPVAPQPDEETSAEPPSAEEVPAEEPPTEEAPAKKKEAPFLIWLLGQIFPPRLVAFLVMAAILLGPLYALFYTGASLYTVAEEGELPRLLLTTAQDAETLRALPALNMRAEDDIALAQNHELISFFKTATLRRAFPVTVTADGVSTEVYVLDETAAEAAAKAGVTLYENDYISPEEGTPLAAGDTVAVYRVTYVERTENEVVPWQEVTKPSPLIADGRTRVMNEGGQRDGLALTTYADRYVNGIFESTELLSRDYIDFPWNVVTLEGDGSAVCSTIDGAQFTDVQIVDNAPTEYQWVIERGVCTAYSYKPGVWGASGMYLFQGCVAVDPDVIPFGSLLYITSPDGSFVYGWAIAADAGAAMMDGRVNIDCFFETYNESCLFGRKYLNIYVVDQLTQDQLEQYVAKDGYFRARIPAA